MIVSMVAGLAFGYILVRGRFSFAAPIKRMVVNGDGSQARSFILMLSLSTIVGGALITGLTPEGIGGHSLYVGAGFGSMIGGLIFGIGMIFSGSCASGALTDLGQGVVSALYVLLFFIVGSVAGQALADQVSTVDH
ncbi:hypothetical protein Zmor_011804 [Zophobas morio]|uniref:Sulphur transport domain-containing protein n=1 Tax=Zophobas morio TaxID=2755281 RepID=A0AA38HI80_9CUCU|nr:hypothetical protein Zmor_011804 [Zophobas morio]